jgi:hypothetical protein
MKGKQKENRAPKRAGGKWDIGDLGDNDTELFKHLPDPKGLIRTKAGPPKKKEKKKINLNRLIV